MEIRAADVNILYGTAQGILLVLVRSTDDVSRKVELPFALVREMKRIFFPSLTAAPKGIKKHRKEWVVPRPWTV